MAISVGGSRGGAVAEMNVVPLIDILLVLLITFMVISPLTPKGLSAQLPQSATESVAPPEGTVVVQVGSNGKVRINNEDSDLAKLGPRMEQIFKDRADKVAFVQGQNDVLFMDVARAIDIMRGSGVDKVGLITDKI